MSVNRKYKGKDAEMLIAAASIGDAAVSHLAALVAKRPVWVDPFFPDFLARIDTAVSTYLGVDNAATLRAQTAAVNAIFKTAFKAIGDVKAEIEVGFAGDLVRRNELLTTLGYKAQWEMVRKMDQEALILILFAFKQNMTAPIRAELIGKGTLATTLDAIVTAAQELLDANVTQESIKQAKKGLTETAVAEFNTIYADLAGICKLARRYLKDVPGAPDQFSYAKVIAGLNSGNITTLYDAIQIIQPGTLLTVSTVRLTSRSRVTLTLLYDLDGVYACRNVDGCYPSQSTKLVFEVALELKKVDLQGAGHYLIVSNPLAENAKVQIKIRG